MRNAAELPAMQQISPTQAKEIHKRLEQSDPVTGDTNPDDERLNYHHPNILLLLEHPGGGFGKYIAHSRYLSPIRMSVITKVFMHEGSRVRVHLPDKVGLMEEEEGTVTRCNYISSSIHEIQISFKNRLNLRRFMELPAHFLAADEDAVNPELISGRALVFSESEADVRLIKHYLRDSRVQFTDAATLGVALDKIRSAPFDIVICGEKVAGIQVDRIYTSLTEAGYSSDFIVIRSAQSVSAAGSDEYSFASTLITPLEEFQVLNQFVQILGTTEGDGDSEQLHSTLPKDASNIELVEWYIDHVKRIIHGLEKATMADAVDDARTCISTLRDTGTSYGFPSLSEHANKLLVEVNASGSIAECKLLVQKCVNITRRMRCMR